MNRALPPLAIAVFAGIFVASMAGAQPSFSGTQKRITGTCSVGTAIRVVNLDGTVTCEAGVGGGISGGGTTGRSTRWTSTGAVAAGAFVDDGTNVSTSGTLSSVTGSLSWGPGGGDGGFVLNATTGAAYFTPMTTRANPWGFGVGNISAPTALLDLAVMPYEPGTANPRSDTYQTLIRGLGNGRYTTAAGDLRVTDIFFDTSHLQIAGANRLLSVLMRLDGNGPAHGGGVDHATALWIDKGEFRNSGHTTYAVRPSTGGGPTAPPVVSACGTGATRTGNDNGGRITVGTTPGGSCSLTFQQTWVAEDGSSVVPTCFVQSPQSAAIPFVQTVSATGLTVTWASGSPTQINWHCFGTDDAVAGP